MLQKTLTPSTLQTHTEKDKKCSLISINNSMLLKDAEANHVMPAVVI